MPSQEDKRRKLFKTISAAHMIPIRKPGEKSEEAVERLISEAGYVLVTEDDAEKQWDWDLEDTRKKEHARCAEIARTFDLLSGNTAFDLRDRIAAAIEAGDE